MKTLLISSVAAGLALAGSVAFAAPHAGPKHGKQLDGWFQKLDVNKDEKLSRQEFDAPKSEMFDRADANKDSIVTLTEMKQGAEARRAQHRANRFSQLDKNADGRVTKDEVPRMPERRFTALDTNNDGAISEVELAAAPKPEADRAGAGKRGPAAERLLARLDADKDGQLTRAEAMQGGAKHFEKLDANSDGYLTKDELKAGKHHRKGPKAGQPRGKAPRGGRQG